MKKIIYSNVVSKTMYNQHKSTTILHQILYYKDFSKHKIYDRH